MIKTGIVGALSGLVIAVFCIGVNSLFGFYPEVSPWEFVLAFVGFFGFCGFLLPAYVSQ